MKIPLKEAVRDHIEQHDLSDARLTSLLELQDTHQPPPSKQRPAWMWWAVGSAVAAAAALVVLFTVGPFQTEQDTPTRIAQEVTQNHIKLKPLEVTSDDMNDVRAFFNELDFVPIDSKVLAASGLRLLGGRYCSIQGQAAAQLRLRSPKTQGLTSVYMAPYTPEEFGVLPRSDRGEKPIVLHSRGLEVKIWVEHDVLIAMTGNP